ncbi:TRAP transporter small permease subunit [Pseudoroseicyclus aestuarii]|uniref:TRAP transporter small permease protein n=1 Tax=Pseudoroseicyclus aestuarii TaxID=1795041 RepID=A0A318TAP5_9RHOB|nr:TRAP transporter small permease [Pseudoroseicyclus aestuarii]PYE85378.1 TRAP-type mannitol/chloroaromatic compound transport system permease small subunit [Pseudoroseicyclus aestuarii]
MDPEDHNARDPVLVPQDPLSAWLAPLGRVVSLAFLFITAITFLEVVLRYGFNAPTQWVHETTIALTAICFAFGGAYCLALDRHIRVVLIYDALSPALRRWFDVGISVIGALACALMAWAAWSLAFKGFVSAGGEFRLETSGSAWNPPTPAIVKAVLFVTLCVMCLQFALQAIRHLRRDPAEETPHPIESAETIDDV